jgi:hypothetical protein
MIRQAKALVCGSELSEALLLQMIAAAAELAIPHFVTTSIFAVAEEGSRAHFNANVKLLAVGSSTQYATWRC